MLKRLVDFLEQPHLFLTSISVTVHNEIVMYPHQNLISKSEKVLEAIKLLKSFGGRTSVIKFAKRFFNFSNLTVASAQLLVESLSRQDPRILVKDGFVELVSLEKKNLKLSEASFVVFDLEATEAKFPPGRIMEIGAYKIKKDKLVDEFRTLVNPETPIAPFVTELTGITQEMVEKSPRFSEIVLDFLKFIDDAILVAHNSRFDFRLLNYEIGLVYEEYELANQHLCTDRLSRKLLQLENYRLQTVADYYSIKIENPHRASDDALATALVFMNLLKELEMLGIEDFETVKKLKSKPTFKNTKNPV
jgi:DNA polymerase III epsilon subunit family exonuclease